MSLPFSDFVKTNQEICLSFNTYTQIWNYLVNFWLNQHDFEISSLFTIIKH